MAEQRRIIRPTQAARATKAAREAEEQAGIDHIEQSMTVEYKHPRKGSYWIKFGATITVQDNETPSEAKNRLRAFVIASLEEQIDEIKG